MKICSSCSVEQEDNQFRSKGGLRCRLCRNKKHLEYGRKFRNSPKGKEAREREYAKHRKEGWNVWYFRRGRAKTLKKYDLTSDDYRKMLAQQKGHCAICGNLETVKNRSLAVDHDHNSGLVRGLLCHKCNLGIANFDENIAFLANAIAYIEKHKVKTKIKTLMGA